MAEERENSQLRDVVLDILRNDVRLSLSTNSDYYGNYDLTVKLIYTDPDTNKEEVLSESSEWLPSQ